jgi:hypothetical protein
MTCTYCKINYNVSSCKVNSETILEISEIKPALCDKKLTVREPEVICDEIGIYSFEDGDGLIKEQLSVAEVPEKPIPRPIIRKRKKERWDPMRPFQKSLPLLHKRWCHKSGLRRTIRFQGCSGLPLSYRDLQDAECLCEACLKAKMSRCIHPPVFRRLWLIGQLVHFDLQEKPIQSWDMKKHTLMCVEHKAKYSKVYFIFKKSGAFEYCVMFIAWIERRTGNKVLAVQCDGGGEFTGELLRHCQKKGINFQKTARANPAENGVAEAYNKVNHQTAEALKYQAHQADKFWPE